MELTQIEKQLSEVLGDLSADGEQLSRRALFTLERLPPALQEISYDDAMALALESEQILEHTPYGDPAHEFLDRNYREMIQLASLLNDANRLGRHLHQEAHKVLVSVRNVAIETTVYVNKRRTSKTSPAGVAMLERDIREALAMKLRCSSEWSDSLRHSRNLDFVVL